MKSTIFVGIAGGSASGKTTLAHKLKECANPNEVDIIYLDSYYRARNDLSMAERNLINYDHPDAFEFNLLHKQLKQLQAGQTVEVPVYDFTQHKRSADYRVTKPSNIIVVEGILTFHDSQIRTIFDDLVYVDYPDQQRLERRIARDIRERGRTQESVISQWEATVQPAFEEFCLPSKQLARLVVQGSGDYLQVVEQLLGFYRGL